MERVSLITTDKQYHQTMVTIYELMNKGEADLRPDELEELKTMAIAA
jgi:HTH-type transcriptional regulator/antitoxin HigA